MRAFRLGSLGAAVAALWACTSRSFEAPDLTPTRTIHLTKTEKIDNNLDLLFMIDDSSSMMPMQQKILAQLPTFMDKLSGLPMGLPSVHIAVVSSDMGATSDTALMSCNNTGGDNGAFFSQPEKPCTGTTLASGASFISSDPTAGQNFTDPIASVFQCVALLGQNGCGFEHQLASIDRALGADGLGPPPASNANFLRADAYLGIILLTNEDDCSAPASAAPLPVFSANGGNPQSISNSDGPIDNYRCNGGPLGGHLCRDPNGTDPTALAEPPLLPPPAAVLAGTTPTLALSDCQSNDGASSGLTPVSRFVTDIQALKPPGQILVGAITAPATPYEVEWLPGVGSPAANQEQWPNVMHACGPPNIQGVDTVPGAPATTDGSFGDPSVRITQFVSAFGENGLLDSICDDNYAAAMTTIAAKLGILLRPPCVDGTIQNDAAGNPSCTVTNTVTSGSGDRNVVIASCAENGGAAPCWTLAPDATACPDGGQTLTVSPDPQNPNPDGLSTTIECALCVPGFAAPGC